MKNQNKSKQKTLKQNMMQYQEQVHAENQKKIRHGIKCVFTIPLLFLALVFLTDSTKVIFLTLWIVSLFLISAYLIYIEYNDFKLQKAVARLCEKDELSMQPLIGRPSENIKFHSNIFRNDFRHISTNVVAIVIILGLSILPSLYAWFNIFSNWNPYTEDATSQLKIAVVSLDQGMELNHLKLCVGDSILETLADNTTMGWVFPKDERTAINGVYDGDYYAALIIPTDFTERIAAVADGDLSGGHLVYYENEKKNAIAAKITSKAEITVENQVNRSVFSTITEVLCNIGDSLQDIQEQSSLTEAAVSRLDTLDTEIKQYISALTTVQNASDATRETILTINTLSQKLTTDLQNDLTLTSDNTISISGLQTANIRLADYADVLNSNRQDMIETKQLLKDLRSSIKSVKAEMTDTKNSEEVQKLLSVLENEPEKIGDYFSSLVNLKTEKVYEIANYGSAMAPFYTILAIWVGALILVAVIHLHIHRTPEMAPLHLSQKFFGRYVIFFAIGQVQTLICILGDLYFLEIQCLHPFLFWLASAVSSFVFTTMIYSLVFVLGNIGEALAVVIMVIQVAGTGGTFPKEVLPEIYQRVYDFLPFPYCMTALRECVGGMYGNDYWIALGKLLLFAIAFILFALILRKPFERLNHKIERSKEKSGLMI